MLGLFAVGMSFSVSSFAAGTAKDCKILVMGDSLSAAYGLAKEQGWVALMETRLAEKFPHCKVVNASVSGETTAGGKTRLGALLKQHQPTHMILELGANDGLRGLSLDNMKDNLTNMLVSARRSETQAVLIGMQIHPITALRMHADSVILSRKWRASKKYPWFHSCWTDLHLTQHLFKPTAFIRMLTRNQRFLKICGRLLQRH